jgi:hypothetical protein
MEKHSSPIMQLTKRRAAFRLRQLMDELRLLTASFPDLHDAFDPNDLPLAFILRRDSRLTENSAETSKPFSPRPNPPVRRRTRLSRTAPQGRHRKQMSDE